MRFNDVYIKNFPEYWGEDELRAIFALYGEIKSLSILFALKPAYTLSRYANICYENPNNKDDEKYGQECALNAAKYENEKTYEGH